MVERMAPEELFMEKEIIFLVEEAAEGGFTARALDHAIFTQAENLEELKSNLYHPQKKSFLKLSRQKLPFQRLHQREL